MRHEHVAGQRVDCLLEGGGYGRCLRREVVHVEVDNAVFANDQREEDAAFVSVV